MTQITWKRTNDGGLPARITYKGGGYRIVNSESQFGSYRTFYVFTDDDDRQPFDVAFSLRAAKELIEDHRRGA